MQAENMIRILLGVNISYASVFVLSQYPMSNSTCVSFNWLKYLGFATVFGSLIVKTYRIAAIFKAKNSKRHGVKLTDNTLTGFFMGIITIWVALMVIWVSLASQRPSVAFEIVAKADATGIIESYLSTPRCNGGDFK